MKNFRYAVIEILRIKQLNLKNFPMEKVAIPFQESISPSSSYKMREIDRQLKKFKNDAILCQAFTDDGLACTSTCDDSFERVYKNPITVNCSSEIQDCKKTIEELLRINNRLNLETAFLKNENSIRNDQLKQQQATIISLQSEIGRLTENRHNNSSTDMQVLKEQLNVYHEDFNAEKRERLKLKERNIFLQTQLEEAKNILESQHKKLLLYSEIFPDSVNQKINPTVFTVPKYKVKSTPTSPNLKESRHFTTNVNTRLQENLSLLHKPIPLKTPLRKSNSSHIETFRFKENELNFSPYLCKSKEERNFSSNKNLDLLSPSHSCIANSDKTTTLYSDSDRRFNEHFFEFDEHSNRYKDLDSFSDIICKKH
ncbi:uncharacterized protein LOC101240241 isoform X5 [Hydra vulgaris]|uniref:Uncharacterized protein LOC101240241 isoform X5 n=1 Tax=Hydra vulgaris TaxID=6087 RepID=A0ABM4C512_HYDVU